MKSRLASRLFLALLLSSFGAESLQKSNDDAEPNKLQEAVDRIGKFVAFIRSHLLVCYSRPRQLSLLPRVTAGTCSSATPGRANSASSPAWRRAPARLLLLPAASRYFGCQLRAGVRQGLTFCDTSLSFIAYKPRFVQIRSALRKLQ